LKDEKKPEEFIPPIWYLKDIRDLIQYIRDMHQIWRKNTFSDYILLRTKTLNKSTLYEFIEFYYREFSAHLLNPLGRSFPILVYPAPLDQRYDLESAIQGGLDLNSNEELDNVLEQAGQNFLNTLLTSETPPWNDPTYRLVELNVVEGLIAKCAMGTYFNSLTTCDILDFELLTKFNDWDPNPPQFEAFAQELKLRNHLHSLESSILIPQGRSAAISISTVVIFRVDNDFKTIIRERSRHVAKSPNLLHVTPSFMFQPVMRFWEEEFSVKHNIYREYLEELFSGEYLEKPEFEYSLNFFYEDQNLKYLIQLVDEGKARFYFTGFSLNLMSLLPEICTLLIINDTEWFKNHSRGNEVNGLQLDILKTNWEFKGIREQKGFLPEGTGLLNLGSDVEIPSQILVPEQFVPFGAAALSLGVSVAQEELPRW